MKGLNTTGRKIELVARALANFEMKLPIIALSEEEQQKKLKLDYENQLQKFKICDPLSIEPSKRIDDIVLWPHIDTGVIFVYILKVKDCDLEYVGRYKDQKPYSYFDSGFVNTIFIYNPSSCRNKIFLYSKVQSSLTVSDKKMLWILVQKEPLEILKSWCSCMAGTSQSCNHVIAVLYKIDHALQKGLLNPSCTSTSCSWNKSTKHDIEPKKIKDIVIPKKIRSRSSVEELGTYKEKERSEELQKFSPVLQSFRKLKDEEVSKFYNKLHDVSPQSAVLLYIHSEEETELETFSLENIATKMDNIS